MEHRAQVSAALDRQIEDEQWAQEQLRQQREEKERAEAEAKAREQREERIRWIVVIAVGSVIVAVMLFYQVREIARRIRARARRTSD